MKHTYILSIISALRFFGLFVVLPTIGLYADAFETSAFLAGLAASGYAMTQVLFQTPFGVAADKFDKKSIIALGLVIFIVGSLVCALSSDITMLIVGRFLQGAGAIGGVISAQIAELTREEERGKAMAIMGGGIFVAFIAAMILGPLLAAFSLSIVFFLSAILSAFSLVLLIAKVPKTPKIIYNFNAAPKFISVLKNKNLALMYLSSFLQKSLMILTFFALSFALTHDFGLDSSELWKFYAPASILGLFAMAPAMIFGQKRGKFKEFMCLGIAIFVISYALLSAALYTGQIAFLAAGIFVFFIGFSIHEPLMQTLASLYPSAAQKGSALGVFNTLGFLGSALGGVAGGAAYESLGLFWLSLLVAAVCAVWLVLMAFLTNPARLKNVYVKGLDSSALAQLGGISGVVETYINQTEGVAVVKYDAGIIDETKIYVLLGVKAAEVDDKKAADFKADSKLGSKKGEHGNV